MGVSPQPPASPTAALWLRAVWPRSCPHCCVTPSVPWAEHRRPAAIPSTPSSLPRSRTRVWDGGRRWPGGPEDLGGCHGLALHYGEWSPGGVLAGALALLSLLMLGSHLQPSGSWPVMLALGHGCSSPASPTLRCGCAHQELQAAEGTLNTSLELAAWLLPEKFGAFASESSAALLLKEAAWALEGQLPSSSPI